MPDCQNCGSHVTDDYARVLGDNDGRVWHCPACPDIGQVAAVRAAHDPDFDPNSNPRVTADGGPRVVGWWE